jgi:hypothetical protein
MKQKLIMETWRRFIQEQKDRGIRVPEERTCLYTEIEPENAHFVLYNHGTGNPGDALMNLSIIGSVMLESLEDSGPCISGKSGEKPSWHILSIHTNQKYRAVGYGSFLYGCAFLMADRNGAGLTSDKYSGSKPEAKTKWSSFEADASSSEQTYTFRQTPDGNKEFDYDGSATPGDPNDDCDVIGDGTNATHFSISHKDPKIFEDSILLYEDNHNDFFETIVNAGVMTEKEFRKFIIQADFKSFESAYESAPD